MILNIRRETALAVLALVDQEAATLIEKLKHRNRLQHVEIHNSIVMLQHMGILKHKIEVGLGLSNFMGAVEWGYPTHGRPPLPFK